MDEAAIGAPSGVSGAADPIIVALCAVCVVTVLRIPLLFRELAVTNDHSRGTIDVLGHLREGVVGLRPVGLVWWLAFLTTGVLWIRWQQSVHAQLYHAGVSGLLRPPWLSVVGWFVPFVSLAVPGLLVGRILGGASVGPQADARDADRGLVVWFWWLVFAPGWVMVTIGAALRQLARGSLDLGYRSALSAGEIVGLLRTGDVLLLIGSFLLLFAAPLAAVVHGQIDGARKRTFASWLPARPDLGESSPLH